MLKGIPAILPPELIKILCEMGHGDEITLGDANFPGHSLCKQVVRMDGHGVPDILNAILTVFPLDTFVDCPLTLMDVAASDAPPPVWEIYARVAARHDARPRGLFEKVERFAFYERVRQHSVAVVMTGETALYANLILKKGVITPV